MLSLRGRVGWHFGAEVGVVRWMCDIGVKDGVPGGESREGLGLDSMVSVLQQGRLHWCGLVAGEEREMVVGWDVCVRWRCWTGT